jgi:hypothetical protein
MDGHGTAGAPPDPTRQSPMIDYDLLITSIFSILFLVVIGGSALHFPLSRKLGHLIEARTGDRSETPVLGDAALRRIVARLDGMEEQIAALTERQEFLDGLLMERPPPPPSNAARETPPPASPPKFPHPHPHPHPHPPFAFSPPSHPTPGPARQKENRALPPRRCYPGCSPALDCSSDRTLSA